MVLLNREQRVPKFLPRKSPLLPIVRPITCAGDSCPRGLPGLRLTLSATLKLLAKVNRETTRSPHLSVCCALRHYRFCPDPHHWFHRLQHGVHECGLCGAVTRLRTLARSGERCRRYQGGRQEL